MSLGGQIRAVSLMAVFLLVLVVALAARELSGPSEGHFYINPSQHYAGEFCTGRPLIAGQEDLAAALDEAHVYLEFSPCLARAARDYVRSLAEGDQAAIPAEGIEFLLHYSGCPDAAALAVVLSTADDGVEEVVRTVKKILAGESKSGYTHVGLARIPDSCDKHKWLWGVMLTRRHFELEPVPARVVPFSRVVIKIRIDSTLHNPRLLVLSEGKPLSKDLASTGGGWCGKIVNAGAGRGPIWFDVVAEGEEGAEIVALFPVWVGEDPARRWHGIAVTGERCFQRLLDAEDCLARLVNRDRRFHGLVTLERETRLDGVARQHSLDMAEHNYFGHISPRCGGLKARLSRKGLSFSEAGENVAVASSIVEAEEELMRSPGHRANILAPWATSFGVGVARGGRDGRWYVTQVFTRPTPSMDAVRWVRKIREEVQLVQKGVRQSQLKADVLLDAVASQLAGEMSQENLKVKEVLARAGAILSQQGLAFKHLGIRTGRIWAPEDIDFGELDLMGSSALGVGVALPSSPDKPVSVVLVIVRR